MYQGVKDNLYLLMPINSSIFQLVWRDHAVILIPVSYTHLAHYANSMLSNSKLIGYTTKMKVYKTLIRPIVSYWTTTWILAKKNKKHWDVLKVNIVRRGYGPVKEDNEWRLRNKQRVIEGWGLLNKFGKARQIQFQDP